MTVQVEIFAMHPFFCGTHIGRRRWGTLIALALAACSDHNSSVLAPADRQVPAHTTAAAPPAAAPPAVAKATVEVEPTSRAFPGEPAAPAGAGGRALLDAPEDVEATTPVRWVPGSEDDVSMGGVRRYTARAWVPLGLSRDALIKATESATWNLYRTKSAAAVAVFFYREGLDADPERIGIFTAAKVTIAPGGQWDRASSGEEPLPHTEIRDSYFESIKAVLAEGASAFLVSNDNASDVLLCATDKLEQGTARRLPHNTPVTVQRSARIPLGGEDLIAYEVATEDGQRGWVHGWSLSATPGTTSSGLLQTAEPNRSVTCNRFELGHTIEGDRLTVSVETDLPEATSFILSVSRSYTQSGRTSQYPLSYFDAHATVGELRRGVQVDISDSVFRARLNERMSLNRQIGEPADVSGVQPDIRVHATVGGSTFGEWNKNLVGSAVTELRSGRRIAESKLAIHRPLRQRD